jgi:hypothetical protein
MSRRYWCLFCDDPPGSVLEWGCTLAIPVAFFGFIGYQCVRGLYMFFYYSLR